MLLAARMDSQIPVEVQIVYLYDSNSGQEPIIIVTVADLVGSIDL